MNNPLLSICIPTYNRAAYLKECLDSIVCQFNDLEIYNQVEIIISDNASEDDTAGVIAEYQKKYVNIYYYRNEENIGAVKNFIAASGLSKGEYLWIFSDDDLQTDDSLKIIIDFIKNNFIDLLFCNLVGFHEKSGSKSLNLLKINNDIIINNRKDLFNLLNKKFYLSIDYYTTLCSNQIIKKEIFNNNYFLFKKFNSYLDAFPLPSLFFYSDIEFKSGIIAKQVILNRDNNQTWGYNNKIRQFFYKDKIWRDYYNKIIKNNKPFLPKYFIFKVHTKNLLGIIYFIKMMIVHFLRKIKVYDKFKKIVKKVLINAGLVSYINMK